MHQEKILNFFLDKRWAIVRHLLLIVPLATTLYPDINPSARRFINISDIEINAIIVGVFKLNAVMFISGLAILYFNFYIVVPKLLFKNKFLAYSGTLLALATFYFFIEKDVATYLFRGYEKYVSLPNFSFKSFIDNTLNPIVFLGATTGYKIFKKWIIDNQRLNDLEKAQLQEELTNLKNQVNPHFLFNTLNNLNTLIQTDTEKATQVVLGLSDVLKYQIYDSNKEVILMSKDIEIVSQFLMLEKIRRDKFSYEILVEDDIEAILIPPLLFINFIDNAVKHSLDNRQASYIKIRFKLVEKHLLFTIENSKPSFIVQSEKGGLGLRNIKRRLELLYQENYELQLHDEPNKYTVSLKIPL